MRAQTTLALYEMDMRQLDEQMGTSKALYDTFRTKPDLRAEPPADAHAQVPSSLKFRHAADNKQGN
eukprot:1773036-Pleurochrysis_carterae.AAC.1